MSLWIRATNISTNPQDEADYTVNVGINDNPLWNGYVRNHHRPDGVPALLRRIAEQMEREKAR